MAAAGPAGNFALALIAFGALKAGLAVGFFVTPDSVAFSSLVEGTSGPTVVTSMLSVFLMLNVLLGTFNLLPLPPLDGASVAGIFVPAEYRSRLRDLTSSGMASLLGLVVAWQVFPLMTRPFFSLVLKLLHPDVSYS
jgi:Zn-dependent protease